MGAGKSLGKPDEMLGVTQGRVVIVIVTLCKLRQAQAVWASRFEYRCYSDLAFCSLGNLTVVKWYCYNVSLNYLPIVPFILNSQYPLVFMAFFKFWSSV